MTCMAVNNVTRELLSTVTDEATLLSVTAERSLLRTLRAGCHPLWEHRLRLTALASNSHAFY